MEALPQGSSLQTRAALLELQLAGIASDCVGRRKAEPHGSLACQRMKDTPESGMMTWTFIV